MCCSSLSVQAVLPVLQSLGRPVLSGMHTAWLCCPVSWVMASGPRVDRSSLSCRCLTQPPVPSAVLLSCSVSFTPLEKWPSAWTPTVDLDLSSGASAGEIPL